MKKEFAGVEKIINGYKQDMVANLAKMISIKAVSPESGGKGEAERVAFLLSLLKSMKLRPKVYRYKDKCGVYRPSILLKYGENKRTVWIVSHTDTVAEGDIKQWHDDPFRGVIKGDRVYGRGTNDNGQSVIASIYAMKALIKSGVRLKYNIGLALVADEEHGSSYGMIRLLEDNLFRKGDMFVVPDLGSQSGRGRNIEVSEKSVAWYKITVKGIQVHASIPNKGVNAYKYLVLFLADLNGFLSRKYNRRNKLFLPAVSTFEFTKHDKNVDNVNIISGSEVSYMDCRILPSYDISKITNAIKQFARNRKYKPARISVELIDSGSEMVPTSIKSENYKILEDAVANVVKVRTRPVGIGASTCGKMVRRYGWPAVVWSIADDVAHTPNEYARIEDMITECKVFSYLFCSA